MINQIKKAIKISRLNVNSKEFEEDIKGVIEMFEEIEKVDVEGIELEILPSKVKNQMREDETYNENKKFSSIVKDFKPNKKELSIGPKLK
ncbi:MAG: hypothetical protein ACOCRX_02830 [Candidatus Woesearchaeota archaeon]